MKLLHNIGEINHPNYNTREQIIACTDELGFDGIYRNVFENRDILKGKKGILFVMGDYVGKDNTFDLPNVPKFEQYCTMQELMQIAEETGFELGWHTWSHRDLTTLPKDEIMKELACPPQFRKYFAYPYGKYNDLVVECVKQSGFEKAWSVTQGNDNKFTLFRSYL